MKKTFFLFIILISSTVFSQLKITGYFDAEIGLSYQFSNKIQVELRANDNLGIEFNSELSLLYKIISKEEYNLNLGFGGSTYPFHSENINFLESYFLPLQIEITPLKTVRNFALVLETAYHFADKTDNSGIRNSIGIRYIFN
ncbi:hypothetical protein [uncultured Polaribacter sp.]|uniref:hypothetical protein n=1 Tax=uncultured Polaribacter sp. TaxID=174711 RepID=UPI002624D08A|nr:hypothetical protein [uncultured Polaribacter sp.]